MFPNHIVEVNSYLDILMFRQGFLISFLDIFYGLTLYEFNISFMCFKEVITILVKQLDFGFLEERLVLKGINADAESRK